MIFKYRARMKTGESVESSINALSKDAAIDKLREKQLIILSIDNAEDDNKKLKNIIKKMLRVSTIPLKTKMVFMRQLAAMIETGIDLNSAFDIIIEQERNLRFRDIITEIKNDVKNEGGGLSIAMANSAVFDDMTLSIIQTGEDSGNISEGLERAADLLEKQYTFKNRITRAMLYPALVMICAVVVFSVFAIYIMPGFKQIFDAMNIEIPKITEFILSFGNYIALNLHKIILAFLAVIIIFYWLTHSKVTRPLIDKIKLKIPVIKNLVFKSAMANSTRTLAALTSAGVPVLDSIEMAGNTAGNTVIKNAFIEMGKSVKNGVPLGDAAKNTGAFPTLVSQMMRIGQETGNLDGMMERVASWYAQELNGEIKTVSSMLEPVMIIIVGIVVGVMVISLMGPVASAMSQI